MLGIFRLPDIPQIQLKWTRGRILSGLKIKDQANEANENRNTQNGQKNVHKILLNHYLALLILLVYFSKSCCPVLLMTRALDNLDDCRLGFLHGIANTPQSND